MTLVIGSEGHGHAATLNVFSLTRLLATTLVHKDSSRHRSLVNEQDSFTLQYRIRLFLYTGDPGQFECRIVDDVLVLYDIDLLRQSTHVLRST